MKYEYVCIVSRTYRENKIAKFEHFQRSISFAFIQALLSTAVFSKKIQFLYCLLSLAVSWGSPMVDTKGGELKFRSADSLKMHFFIFLEIYEEF